MESQNSLQRKARPSTEIIDLLGGNKFCRSFQKGCRPWHETCSKKSDRRDNDNAEVIGIRGTFGDVIVELTAEETYSSKN